jgi:hypothetical protein
MTLDCLGDEVDGIAEDTLYDSCKGILCDIVDETESPPLPLAKAVFKNDAAAEPEELELI